jgi:ABC-type thiamin/hydroxymethylpyrimidine transport system permease subunit
MAALGDKIADKALDYLIAGAVWIAGTLLPGIVGAHVIEDPFYHDGWLQENRAWIILFFITWLVSTSLALRLGGLLVVTLLGVVSAIVFAVFYGGSTAMSDGWQVALWVNHGVAYSLLPAIVTGWVVLALKWTGVL